ncbi:MAG: gliding motility-associated C-terminal domain-containing protein [Bacteroidia bacterium]
MKRRLYLALFSALSLCVALQLSAASYVSNKIAPKPDPSGVSGSLVLTTQPLSSNAFCWGSAVVVEFSATGGFDQNSIFSVELSNPVGDFSSPTVLPTLFFSGSVSANNTYIYTQIPSGTPEGSGYRIRIVSSNPSFTGTDNGVDLTITDNTAPSAPTVTPNGPTSFCFGSASTFLLSSEGSGNLWFPGGVNTNPFIGVVSSGNFYTQYTSGSCVTSSLPVTIDVNTPIFAFLGYFENGELASTADTTVNVCQGDSAEIGVIIEGGTAPFDIIYTFDGFNFITADDVGTPASENTNVYNFFVTEPGIYQLVGIQDNFPTPCGSQGISGSVTVQLVPPPVTAFSYEPFCGPNSGAPVAAPGFVGGGVYTFDPAPIDGATIDASTGVISNAVIGSSYTVRYTVSEGLCTNISSTFTLTVNTQDITDFTLEPFCEGAASDFPQGAVGFAGGGTYAFNPAPSDGASINAVTGIITNAAGLTTYTVVYTSPEGACQASSSSSVTTLDAPEVSVTVENSQCSQAVGSANATVTEGVAPYVYSWSNGASTEDISGLESGAYSLTVTDNQGCETEASATIINDNQPELVFSVTDANCGANNGAINLTINNGVGPFSITWTPGGETTEDLSGLSAGTYNVEVTDNGTSCEVSGSADVLFFDAPVATFTSVNSLCGQSVGSIDVTVTGGEAPISHSWSNGATTEDLSNINAGVYVDTITDANGCFTIISVNIINENQFTLNASVTNPTCGTPNGGSIDLTVNGGDAPFLFNWSPNTSDATEDVNGLIAGSYDVIVTDNAGCVDSLTATINPAAPLEGIGTVTPSTCTNAEGAIDLNVSGGSGSYTFLWTNGAITEDISNLEAGSYSVLITDAADLNCTLSLSFEIENGNQFDADVLSENASCTSNDGSISTTVSNGSGSFAYIWSGPDGFTSTDADLTNLAIGEYFLLINDVNTGCQYLDTLVIELENAPTFTSTSVNTSCGLNNGLIDIEVSGGTEPYAVTWNGSSSTIDQLNLAAGTYEFILTDANNCQISQSFVIAPSIAPSLTGLATNPTCGNDEGNIDITLTDAANPVIYTWTKDGANFANTEDISALSPGSYVINVSDAAGCLASDTFNLIYENLPVLSSTIVESLCGEATGSIDLSIEGGTAPFTFSWTGPNGFAASTEDISSLGSGCYTVSVTDDASCEVTLQACISNNDGPQISFSTVQPSCNEDNGSITPTVSGGAAPYTLNWSGTVFSVDSIIDNLGNGNYILTVVDANGCETIDSVALNNTGVPVLTGDINDPACGTNDGSITAVVSGGVAPYTYLWTPGGSTDATISGLSVGSYNVVVTDAAGCEVPGQFSLINLNAPVLAFTFNNSVCGSSDGSIDLTVSEGSGDYTYVWTGDGVNTSSEDQNNLSSGSYSVVVTDNVSGCEATVSVDIQNTDQPVLTLVSVGSLCGASSGSIDLTVSNASNPTFSWTGPDGFTATTEDISGLAAGVYTVTVSDGDCEVEGTVTVSPTKSVWSQNVNLVAGSQYDFQMFAQNVILNSPAILRVYVGGTSLGVFSPAGLTTWTPFNASFTASASGVTEVKIVNENLSPSGNDFGIDDISLIEICPAVPPPGSTCGTNIIINGGFESGNTSFLSQYTFVPNGPANNELIPEGTYSVAANANTLHPQFTGTGRSGNFMVVNGNEPEDPILSFSTVSTSCSANNGSINLTVTNFTVPISYAWTGPNGFTATTQDLNGLASGEYNVTVTSGACVQNGSATVGFSNLPVLALSATDASCGTADGSIDLTVTGGTAPTFSWSGPDGFTATTEDITNLTLGTYVVTVTDGSCIVEDSIDVNDNSPELALNAIDASCGALDGSIDLTVTNGSSPTFSWTGPDGFAATTEDISGLAIGTYAVTVTDGACTVEGTASISSNNPQLSVNATATSCGASSGSVDLTVTDAVNPSFSWTGPSGFAATTEDISNLAAGVYNVTVTDGACAVEATATILTNEFQVSTIATLTSCGASSGSIDLTVTDAVNPSFSWTGPSGFAATTEDISNLAAGVYNVTVTDGSCTVEASANVDSEELTLSFVTTQTSCGATEGGIDLTVSNSANPSFSWSGPDGFSATTEDLSGLAAGTYSVTVTDGTCSVEGTATVTSSGGLITATINTTTTTCGLCNGSAEVTVTSGSAPFSYQWSNGASVPNPNALCSGDVSVVITDAEGCVLELSASIAPSVAIGLSTTQVNSECGLSTGSIDLTVTDGLEPITYSWTGSGISDPTIQDLTGLAAGTYTVEVTDAALCSASTTVTLINSNEPVLSLAASGTLCGQSTGSIDLTVTNASAATFSWSGPNGFAATTEDVAGLAAGDYTVTVTDGTCSAEGTATVINTDGPSASISVSAENICGGENVSVTIDFTGTAPYNFSFTDGANPVTITNYDASQYVLNVPVNVTTTFTLLSVTSANNPDCAGSFVVESATVNVNPSPTAPTITAGGPLVFCEGGSVILTSSQQTGNVWNITGSEQFNQSITVSTSGDYFVTVVSDLGCSDTSDIITVEVLPAGVEASFSDTTICAGSSIQLSASGNGDYLWSPSVYLTGTIIQNPICTPFATTTYVVTGSNACGTGSDTVTVNVLPIAPTSLGADQTVCQNSPLTLSVTSEVGATYSWSPSSAIIGAADGSSAVINTAADTQVILQTTNSNGCVFADTLQLTVVLPTATFSVTANGPTTFCSGESVVLQASTGNLVVWSNGLENFDEILVTESGSYFAVYNGANCPVYSDTIEVTVNPLPSASIIPNGSTTICSGACVDLAASTAQNISWTLPNGSVSTDSVITACLNGWYILSRTENGCIGSDSLFVTVTAQLVQPEITLDGSNVICAGQATSTLISSYALGNQWYFNGSPIAGATTNELVAEQGGFYSVVVTAPGGCADTSDAIEIIVKSVDPIQITAADTIVCNDEVINIVLTASPGYVSYLWGTSNETTQSITATYLGQYAVTGINADGCSSTDYIEIIPNDAFDVLLNSPVYYEDFNISYLGANDGSIELTVDGGSGSFVYNWSNGSTQEDQSNLAGGEYSVTVTDEQGCSIQRTIFLNEPGLIKLPNGFTPNGDGFNDNYVISGIQGYPGNQVNIFNRWGSLVYSAKDYQNNWNGEGNNGNLLPDGTYFIVVNLNKEGFEDVQSYIDLRRN